MLFSGVTNDPRPDYAMPRLFLRTVGTPTGRAYAWQEQYQEEPGLFIDNPEGRSGSADDTPAYMADASEDVVSGTICEGVIHYAGWVIAWPIGSCCGEEAEIRPSEPGDLQLDGFAPTIKRAIRPPAGNLTLNGFAPDLTSPDLQAGELLLDGFAPSVAFAVAIATGELLLGGLEPSTAVVAFAPAGNLTLDGFAPTTATGVSLDEPGDLQLDGFAPTIEEGGGGPPSIDDNESHGNASFTTPGDDTWTVPAGVFAAIVRMRGAGGAGGATDLGSGLIGDGGGGGGEYSEKTIAVTPSDVIPLHVAPGVGWSPGSPGNDAGQTWFVDNTTALANGGKGGGGITPGVGGLGGTGGIGDVTRAGGDGGTGSGLVSPNCWGGGGGGCAGSSSAGGDGGDASGADGSKGVGGSGTYPGGDGGEHGTDPTAPGGADMGFGNNGGGSLSGSSKRGQIDIEW